MNSNRERVMSMKMCMKVKVLETTTLFRPFQYLACFQNRKGQIWKKEMLSNLLLVGLNQRNKSKDTNFTAF